MAAVFTEVASDSAAGQLQTVTGVEAIVFLHIKTVGPITGITKVVVASTAMAIISGGSKTGPTTTNRTRKIILGLQATNPMHLSKTKAHNGTELDLLRGIMTETEKGIMKETWIGTGAEAIDPIIISEETEVEVFTILEVIICVFLGLVGHIIIDVVHTEMTVHEAIGQGAVVTVRIAGAEVVVIVGVAVEAEVEAQVHIEAGVAVIHQGILKKNLY